MPRNAIRAALLLLATLAVAVVAACGGSDSASEQEPEGAPRERQAARERPGRRRGLRIFFDNAPAAVGDKLELTFDGPLRNNGADKLPSLDWKVAFSGLTTKFTSRIVSTGDNFFINLGGQDFEAGQQAVARVTEQAQASKQKGLAQVGLNPLAAVKDVKESGTRTFDGEKLTVYSGTIDPDAVMDQYERLSQSLPTTGAAQAVPQGRLTPQQRAQVKRTFGSPRFEAAVADGRHRPPALADLEVHDPGGQPGRRGRHHRRPHRVQDRRTPPSARPSPSRRRRTRSRSRTSRASCSASSPRRTG